MITVVGASGSVGGELVGALAARGVATRAMTRRPEAMSVPAGVEVVAGDASEPGSLDAAFAGARAAFLMSAQHVGTPDGPTHVRALVDAARRAGVEHLVLLSVYSGGSGDDVIGAWHGAQEGVVTGSGLGWTLLRPGRFFSNALHWAHQLGYGDAVHVPFAYRPAAGIDPADIAAVAAVALTAPDPQGRALRLTGPEVLTPTQEIGILAEVLDRPLRVVPVGDAVARDNMITQARMDPEVVDAALARVAGDEGTVVLPAVSEILGRPPRSFRDWALAHASAFDGSPG